MYKAAYRDRDPHKLPISPQGDRLNHTPLAHTEVPQPEPQQNRHAQAVRVHKPNCGAEQPKVVLEGVCWGRSLWVGQVRGDGGGER